MTIYNNGKYLAYVALSCHIYTMSTLKKKSDQSKIDLHILGCYR